MDDKVKRFVIAFDTCCCERSLDSGALSEEVAIAITNVTLRDNNVNQTLSNKKNHP